MSKKKKWIVMLLALAVLAALIFAAFLGVSKLNERREKIEAEEEMLYAGWNEYLRFLDEVDNIELWTLEYLNDYLQEPSWEHLLKARAAVAAATEAAKKVKVPDVAISRTTKELLKEQKEELEAMSSLLAEAAMKLDGTMMFLEEMGYNLEDFFLYQPDRQQAKKYTAQHEAMLQNTECYAGVFTNRLFQIWDMKDRWNTMLKSYPSFASFCDPWEDNSALLEKKMGGLVDAFNRLTIESHSLLEQSELMLQAVERGDLKALAEFVSLPSGMPRFDDGSLAAFPYPQWLQEPASIHYAVPAGEGEAQLVRFGDELTQTPILTYYYYDYVTCEEFESYYQDLETLGFVLARKDNEDNSIFMAAWDDYRLTVQWSISETVLRIGNPMSVLLSPMDYIMLLNN